MKTIKHNNILAYNRRQGKECRSLSFVCRGCAMRGRERIWEGFVSSISGKWGRENDNSYMTLEEEPENAYDPNAIMVVCRGEFFGTMGYVGKEYTRDIKDILDNCRAYRLDMQNESDCRNKEINLVLTWE